MSSRASQEPTPVPLWRRRWWLAALGILAAFAVELAGQEPGFHDVVRVIDGDTIVVDSVGTVRLIGIDTPETVDPRKQVEFFGLEASAHLREMLSGERVRLDFDQTRRDRFGRTLAYLYLQDGRFVNKEMVLQGYAHAYVKYPFRYLTEFVAAEREAREAGRGLWKP